MGFFDWLHGMHGHHSRSTSATELAKDPVCGMDVSLDTATATSVYQGINYYFCAQGCKVAFDKDPTRYLDAGMGAAKH